MGYVLKTENLTKTFGKNVAVNNVNMTIEPGEIYGFIGKNGAGKTTLLRMVLSLARPTSGTVSLFDGMPFSEAGPMIGSLIEAPGLYKHCTAYENLYRFAIAAGTDYAQIPSLLNDVGLGGVSDKKVGNFSLGMKQRLGIAAALLGHPKLLVLDEPVNGLDPEGIKDVRDTLVRINRQYGTAMLISSHLLDELSKIATKFGIINYGTLLDEFSSADLSDRMGNKLIITTDSAIRAANILSSQLPANAINLSDDRTKVIVFGQAENAAHWNRFLIEQGIEVSGLQKTSNDLEEYYIERVR